MMPVSRPKKNLGQNFLNDQRILAKIISACALSQQDIVVEIGPGMGALTRLLVSQVKALHAIEFDKDMINDLRAQFNEDHVRIIQADFLNWDFSSLMGVAKVVGNIPYYISTPIIERLLENRVFITEAFLTVQSEFGLRLAAKPGGKEYGSLTCFVQYYADVDVLFKIRNTCFKPIPQVDSCFIRLAFRAKPLYNPKNEQLMFKMIRQAFSQRRKTILNVLSMLASREKLTEILNHLKIPIQTRPECLTLQNFVDIADALC